MYLLYLLVLLICVYETQHSQDHNKGKFDVYENYKNTTARILQLMRSYYEEANSRLAHLNNIRFMYEESPYYEMGYITGEIIERYRKVLEMAQRPVRFLYLRVPEIIKIVELTQKLYFELYHLVRMIHETPRKWRNETEFQNIEKIAGPELLGHVKTKEELEEEERGEMGLKELLSTQKYLQDTLRREEKERRRRKKEFEKQREKFLKGQIKELRYNEKVYNKWWPLDYGWEIDYEW